MDSLEIGDKIEEARLRGKAEVEMLRHVTRDLAGSLGMEILSIDVAPMGFSDIDVLFNGEGFRVRVIPREAIR